MFKNNRETTSSAFAFNCSGCGLKSLHPRDEWVVWWNELGKPRSCDGPSDMEMISGGEAASYCSSCWHHVLPNLFHIRKRGLLTGAAAMQFHECYSCLKALSDGMRVWDLCTYQFKRVPDRSERIPEFMYGLTLCNRCVATLDIKSARLVLKKDYYGSAK